MSVRAVTVANAGIQANILLVDDEAANLLALEAVLDPLGQRLVRAGSGNEALRFLEANDCAVVLLDMRMPDLDGFETAKIIRSHERSRRTPIIFLTGFATDEFPVVEAYKLGAVDCLFKPLVPEILRAKVAVFVDLYRQSELARRQVEELQARDRRDVERARMEWALRVSENRLLEAQRIAGLGNWEIDWRSKTVQWSDEMYRLCGVQKDEFVPSLESFLGLLPEEDRARVLAAADVAIEFGQPYRIDHRLVRPDGSVRVMNEHGEVIFDEDGSAMRFVGTMLDITERTQAEEQSKRLLAEVSQRSRQLEVLSRASQRVNAVLEVPVILRTLVAFARELVGAESGMAGIVSDDRVSFREYDARGSRHTIDLTFTREDAQGVASWVLREGTFHISNDARHDPIVLPQVQESFGIRNLIGIPIFDRRGQLIACCEIHNRFEGRPFGEDDLTVLQGLAAATAIALENARLYRELRESESRHRQLADNLPAGFIFQVLHFPGEPMRFSYVSGGVEALFGIKPAEALAEPRALYGLIATEDLARMRILAEECVGQRTPFDCHFRVLRRDGTQRWLHARSAPRPLAEGGSVWDGIAVDITERVQAAEALCASEESLRDANRRKDDFLAMLAHELRNPLGPIRNSLHILRLRGNDGQTVDTVREMMERQVQHLTRMVDDLLDVSRITRGKIRLRTERLDWGRFVRLGSEDHRRDFESLDMTFSVAVPATPVWVCGDPTRLAQSVDNLLANALKFTNAGGAVKVELSVDDERHMATLSIRDTGVGIDPAVLPRLFGAFTQAEQSLDRSQGGLGLGLAIVKGMVELHGGIVSADSQGPGSGATFTISLPLAEGSPSSADESLDAAPASRRLRVLVVEDSTDAADSLRLLLEMSGYEVSVAHTGPDGVRIASLFKPEVVLCDLGLPGMDGFAVASMLRSQEETRAARLIAITGYGRDEDRTRAREAGFDEHLTKPVDPRKLLEELSKS